MKGVIVQRTKHRGLGTCFLLHLAPMGKYIQVKQIKTTELNMKSFSCKIIYFRHSLHVSCLVL